MSEPPLQPEDHLTVWIRKAQAGDQAAFGRLCAPQRLQKWLVAITVSLPAHLRSKCDPADILQEALTQVWNSLSHLHEVNTEHFQRWVLKIAHNAVIDTIRHHHRQKREVDREQALPDWSVTGSSCRAGLPGESLARREQLQKIVEVLDLLPENYRDIIVFRVLEGYSTQEVAQMTGQSPESVSVALHRALSRLRQVVEDRGIASTIFRPV